MHMKILLSIVISPKAPATSSLSPAVCCWLSYKICVEMKPGLHGSRTFHRAALLCPCSNGPQVLNLLVCPLSWGIFGDRSSSVSFCSSTGLPLFPNAHTTAYFNGSFLTTQNLRSNVTAKVSPQVRGKFDGKIATVGLERTLCIFCFPCVRKTWLLKCTSWPFLKVLFNGFKCFCLSVQHHHHLSLELSSFPIETVTVITTPHCFPSLQPPFNGFCVHVVSRDLHDIPFGFMVTSFCLTQQILLLPPRVWIPTVWISHGVFTHSATEWCCCEHRCQASLWGSAFSSLGYLEMELLDPWWFYV